MHGQTDGRHGNRMCLVLPSSDDWSINTVEMQFSLLTVWCEMFFSSGIALVAQAIPPIRTRFSTAWSVSLSSVCLSHSCTLLKLFNGFRCHLAGTLVGFSDTLHLIGVHDHPGEGEIWEVQPWAETFNCKLQPNCQSCAATWRIQLSSWVNLPQHFHLLPNYVGRCFSLAVAVFVILMQLKMTLLICKYRQLVVHKDGCWRPIASSL